ncbi:sigma-54-dependent Fis family transcriptional regulator [Rhodoferax sp.]|uniref:sigma-54-dependent Fis family transcriptional regulator n=1 Tax=Rhodoferax sp. TaxID=50421 RepID=UPI002849B836|nr:sigma-54-dependent Fis family transcriptional regulator [Rhodoferax sp.]MDR3370961.1 sigma-54-dependent Fis family transcriptional regulator [Rhodoferax sp.]
MNAHQRDHIDTVMQAVAGDNRTLTAADDSLIHDSWRRCARDYRLDPTRMQDAIILPSHRLREHQERMDEILQIARSGMQALYQHVAGLDYVVLLTDARGVTVDFLGDLHSGQSLRRAGLYLGSDWSESVAGTCGVGTCISTGQALTVHQGDHFDATHIPLTCTTAPVFDGRGQLNAVLDISALRSPQSKDSQHLALQMVKIYAQYVENASFMRQFRQDWVLRLSPSPQFLEVNPDYLLALDAAGRVIGYNRRAQLLLQDRVAGPLMGAAFERLFNVQLGDLGRFLQNCPADRRAITVAGSSQLLFLLATPPPAVKRPVAAAATQAEPVPAPLAALCGGDAALSRQIARAARFVNSPVGLLLTGETGSGKEFFAKALHASSERRNRPFVAVNCAAIPEALAESELFGYLPGSFSGAGARTKRGLVQEADGGTLFLDEIGDMTLLLQARLLRVLAEREVLPVGATRPVPVNIRVIAATHCDLEALVRAGRFRADLYYRLNGAHLVLPPLRQRTDLNWLIDRMLANQQDGDEAATPVLSTDASARLLAHHWPGNLRELHNVIAYARSLCHQGVIELYDLPDDLGGAPALDPLVAPSPSLAAAPGGSTSEAAQLLQQLAATRWNVAEAARRMGLSRMTLYRRMQRWGIASPNQRDGDAAS